jgi:hypothetical protein
MPAASPSKPASTPRYTPQNDYLDSYFWVVLPKLVSRPNMGLSCAASRLPGRGRLDFSRVLTRALGEVRERAS